MPRVLIISEDWPIGAERENAALSKALSGAGFEVDVITNERRAAAIIEDETISKLIRLPVESSRTSGTLFGLRNALFFDAAANPGNYSQFRDRLHMHLQETLYDAVIIVVPPQIYLRLGYWIDETFGIPVWIHLTQAFNDAGKAGFTAWNHRRLRRKYLGSARLITASSVNLLRNIPRQQEQLVFVAKPQDEMTLQDPETGIQADAKALLASIVRKKAD
jgi:hypothetical protein